MWKWILAASVSALMSVQVAQAQDRLRFIVVSHGPANDPYHSVVKNGIAQAGKDLGIDIDYRAPETSDMVKMGQLIDAAANQQPDGLIVTIPDPSALGEPIKRAIAAGIPVVSYNSGLSVYKDIGTLTHVGQDEYLTGKLAAEGFKQLGSKHVVCLNHDVGNIAQDERCQGLNDGMGTPVKVLPGKSDPSQNASIAKAALQSDPEIDGIFCTSTALCAEPAVKAAKEVGSKALVGSTSMSPAFLDLVAKGEAGFAMDQQQFLQGYMPVVILNNYIRYDLMPAQPIITGPRVITKDLIGRLPELAAQGIR